MVACLSFAFCRSREGSTIKSGSNFFPFATIWTRLINGCLFGVRLDRWVVIGKRTKKLHDLASNGRVVVFVDFVSFGQVSKKLSKLKTIMSRQKQKGGFWLENEM